MISCLNISEILRIQFGDLKELMLNVLNEEVLTTSRANLRIRVRFLSGHLLEVNEAIDLWSLI
jgi:hypothetical protein